MIDEARARESALRILGRRDHSTAQLRRKLLQKGFSPEVAEATVAYLIERGYLDDRRFAERWATAALEGGRCYGPRLRFELRQRGVDPSVAADVMASLTSGADELQAMQQLVSRRFPGFDPRRADDRDKRRIFGFLQRRGFSPGAIMALFRGRSGEEFD